MLILIAILILVPIAVYQSVKLNKGIKKFEKEQSKKVIGIVIYNDELSENSFYRLGAGIYYPTVSFTTLEGIEIIGKPIIGFTSQEDLPPIYNVYVFYNPRKPKEFYIELSDE